MAEIKWNKVGEYLFETSDTNANFAACKNTIAEAFGLSLESETSTSSKTTSYYKIESLSNGGITIILSSNNFSISNFYYTLENGTFKTFGAIGNSYVPLNNTNRTYGIRCYKIEIGGYYTYIVKGVNNNINESNICCFGIASLTDYFSGQSCKVLMGSYSAKYFSAYYAYEKTTKTYLALNTVIIGGSSYPIEAKNITIAVPVFFQNEYNYGYLGSSPNLYKIYPEINLAVLGYQIQINGKTFEHLGNGIYGRVG